jgi:MFS family permease
MVSRPIFYGWFVALAAFVTLLLTVGVPFYGIPFFYDHFIKEFNWSRAQTTGGIAIATILVQPISGLLVHRYSSRKLIILGAFLLLLAMGGFALGTGSLLLYYCSWCVFMGAYVFAGPIPHQVILTQWFRKRRGLAIGLAYHGIGLGGAISQKYVALPLIQCFGWRTALLAIGASMLLLTPVLWFVVCDRPSEKGLLPDGDPTPAPEMAIRPSSFRDLLSERSFWLLAFGSFCSIGAIGSINQHMKLLFQDAGFSAAAVADTTFLILISSLVGRIAMGWLADRYSKKFVMLAAYLFVAAPIPLLFAIATPGAPRLFAVLFGFGLGADYMLIPLMAAQLFGPNSLARAMGVILPADSVGQTCFPFLLGILHDRYGNYHYGLILLIVLALCGALAVSMLPGVRSDVTV